MTRERSGKILWLSGFDSAPCTSQIRSYLRHLESEPKEALDPDRVKHLMDEKTDSWSSVIVLEEGAEWPQWVAEYQRHTPNSVVAAHALGESKEEFLARTARRISEIQGDLRVAIVACASTTDEAHLSMREHICQTMLRAMGTQSSGEVLLAARIDATDASKHAIFDLAETLCEGLRGSQRVVRVRFSNGRPESGIMAKISAPDAEDDGFDAVASAAPRR